MIPTVLTGRADSYRSQQDLAESHAHEERRRSERSARAGKPGEPWPERVLYRSWTHLVSRPLAAWQVSPHAVTLATISLGLAGTVLVAVGDWRAVIVAAVLLQFWVAGDYVGGEVARLRGVASWAGGYTDTVLNHLLVQPLLLAAVAVAAWRTGGPDWVLLLGVVGALSLQWSMSLWLLRTRGGTEPTAVPRAVSVRSPKISGLAFWSTHAIMLSLVVPALAVGGLLWSWTVPAAGLAWYGVAYPAMTAAHVWRALGGS